MFLEELRWLNVNAVRHASVWLALIVLAGSYGKNLGAVANIEQELTLGQMLWGPLVLTYRDTYIFAVTFHLLVKRVLGLKKESTISKAKLSFLLFSTFGSGWLSKTLEPTSNKKTTTMFTDRQKRNRNFVSLKSCSFFFHFVFVFSLVSLLYFWLGMPVFLA